MKPLTIVASYRKYRYKHLTWRQIKRHYGLSISKLDNAYYIITDNPDKIRTVYDDLAYFAYRNYTEVACPQSHYRIMEKLDVLTGNHWFYQELTFAE